MDTTFVVNTNLTTITCGQCAGIYAIAERYRKECYQEGISWRCPYCGVRWGYAEGENTRLKRELARAKHQIERVEAAHERTQSRLTHAEACRRAERAAKTRIKRRIANGVCPCCKRHFTNLERHMQTKHPGWAEQES